MYIFEYSYMIQYIMICNIQWERDDDMDDIFKHVIETIKEGVMIIDNQYKFIYANNAINTIGLDNEAIIGKSIFEVFPNLNNENSTFCKVMATKEPLVEKQQTFITYRGERKTTLTSTYPLIQKGSVIGAFETFQDISTLQDITDQLREMQVEQNKYTTQKNVDSNVNVFFSDFIGESPNIIKLKSEIQTIAKSPSPIFIYGETGTGKEVYVNAIHQAGNKNVPLITQNCAAIPRDLLEAYFFGTMAGSFTGAVDREGLFELANGGILFLDEINSLPIDLQAKLLRVIQEQKVRRVGGTKEFPIRVRIIAASNVHPKELLMNQELREDLYYRLSVLNIELPPLRSRRSDISLLVNRFIQQYNELFDKNILGLTEEAYLKFYHYEWPGNIRELRNVIERLMNVKESGYIDDKDIDHYNVLDGIRMIDKTYAKQSTHYQSVKSFKEMMEETEIDIIKKELFHSYGNISQAARNLDMPQQSLSNKVKKYQLSKYILEVKLLNNE